MGVDSIISQRIKKYRKLRKMTQAELAEEIGVATEHITSVECERRRLGTDKLIPICKALNITMSELLPVDHEDDTGVKAQWRDEIVDALGDLDSMQLGFVRTVVGALRG